MNKKILVLIITVTISLLAFNNGNHKNDTIVSYELNSKTNEISMYWKTEEGIVIGSLKNLRELVQKEHKKLLFAINGGMYKKDKSPQGLFIQNGILKSPLDTTSADGNFYMKPNGIFYLTKDNKAIICKTEDYKNNSNINFATQSGPMLLIDGKIHKNFNEKSVNLNIRNGVGILPNDNLIFAISKKEISFYEFANFFKSKGCKNALYLDGFVSRMYNPKENWLQTDGDFGVIIAVTK
ncbi:phosphodiester glycosidase family protein [Flavobacterium sp. SUN052]|uniref:phosphodiester glycosidase family protein n=1 Tax=Flavobacterium sp. SUN052 TaxID=3002441 RepID=UPI00237DF1DD|nr:phosphodiester glycosidase family protein [Flavobacterium sp. SUN052]MEC4005197.1 phosphodiester glycosidase family protein [Flavobacterium sp. SUN052]